MLSLPMFAIMPQSVRRGFVGLSRSKNHDGNTFVTSSSSSSSIIIIRHPYTILALNLLTQLICVAGVNQLSSVRFFKSFPLSFGWPAGAVSKIKRPIFSLIHFSPSPFPHSSKRFGHSLFIYLFAPIRECPRSQHRSYSRLARR